MFHGRTPMAVMGNGQVNWFRKEGDKIMRLKMKHPITKQWSAVMAAALVLALLGVFAMPVLALNTIERVSR